MRRAILLIAPLLLFCGCASTPVGHNAAVKMHLTIHRKRPPAIQQGLREGQLVEGMTPREVELCWGNADKKEHFTELDGTAVETWYFARRHSWGSKSERSAVWDVKVHVKEASFTNAASGPLLSDWFVYSELPRDRGVIRVRTGLGEEREIALRYAGTVQNKQGLFAMINHKLVAPDDVIEGCRLLTIEADAITVEHRGRVHRIPRTAP